MAAMTSVRLASPNRRRRVRHKIQTPAYASFTTESNAAPPDLYEILDISEEGVAIQCPSPLDSDKPINLCLDLAECAAPIQTVGQVIWSSASGRAGLHFSELPADSLFRLREWLFLNVMAGVANAEADIAVTATRDDAPNRPNYTDTLATVTAVQREVENLGADLSAALQLIASRAHTLVRASGAAIALASSAPDFMDCRASAGADAPPVGARLQVGSGFSGECVKTGNPLRCDDADTDTRVDRESCRALGIRSIVAVPVRIADKSVGIIEAFSPQPFAFCEDDSRVLQRLADTVLTAINRAMRAENLPELVIEKPVERFAPNSGSVLFASPEEEEPAETSTEKTAGVSLPRSLLVVLVLAAAAVFMALGYTMAPWLQSKLQGTGQNNPQTVLASSQPPKSEIPAAPVPAPSAIETATLPELKQLAERGDAAAENVLGLRYFQGDGVKQDESEAVRWFTAAAESGNVAAQSKLGFLYWSGRGVTKDLNKAYLWTVVACDDTSKIKDPAVFLSKDLAQVLRNEITHDQAAAIEHQARQWVQVHHLSTKPAAGH